MALSSPADIVFFGGGAGGGKSYALLLEPVRHYENGDFGAVIFRRNTTQIRNEGGLWDESQKIYTLLNAHPREAFLDWTFKSGARMKFAHLEYDKTVLDYQGAQIPFIGFDEITHFSEYQFTYMLSRNRSTSGVSGYIRATCNPDVDSWVRRWVDWYIGEDGFPIPERSGVIRWFIRINENIIWGNSKEELIEKYGEKEIPKSFTFIPSKVTDNKILMEKDPTYIANLRALSRVERERLLDGNWNIKASAGNYFRKGWFPMIDAIPAGWAKSVRYWDRAATKPNESNKDPDWTRGLKLIKLPNKTYVVADLQSLRDTPLQVENLIKNTASQDTRSTVIFGEQEGGSAGVGEAGAFTRMLAGYQVHMRKPTKDKETRAKPVSAQAEAGNILVLRAPWNDEFFQELENFPQGTHDDIVDAFSGAFNELCENPSILEVL